MRVDSQGGFLPGIFSRSKKKQSRKNSRGGSNKMEPKPSEARKKVPKGIRNEFLAMSGEFVGTFMFLFFAFAGTQIANTPTTINGVQQTSTGPNTSVLLYIALCFGFSLAVNAWVFFRVTGGLFNPAVTLGLFLIGSMPFKRAVLVLIAQLLGAMASAGVASALFPGPLLVSTTLSAGTSKAQGVFIEMFLTAGLVFTIFMLAAEKHKSTFLAPVGIGLSLFIAELAGVYFTGGSLNPARSFGPCVVLRSFPSEHWIYWVGPLLGAIVAAGFFWFIKTCDYESVNPGQDFDDLEASAYDPDSDLTRPVVHPTAQIEQVASRASTGGSDRRANSTRNSGQYQQYQQYPQYQQPQQQTYQEKYPPQATLRDENRRSRSRGTSKTYTIQSPNGRTSHDNYQYSEYPQRI